MSLGRPRQPLILIPEEKQKLELIARRPKTSQSQALRARIVLACAGDDTHQSIARKLGTTPATVGKWRNRFVKNRLQALGDAPRSGPPRSVSDAEIEQIITRTLERKPKNATHWSTRTMAKESGWSHDTIRRIWQAFGLQPHRQEQFKLSTDPFFVEKVHDSRSHKDYNY